MKLKTYLSSLPTTDLALEQQQRDLIAFVIENYSASERRALFQAVTNYRIEQLVALFPNRQQHSWSILFTLIDYRDLIQRCPYTASVEWAVIENAASQCYVHWLEFWCQCEIAAIKAKYPIDASSPLQVDLPANDDAYYGGVIKHIEQSELLVQTPSHPQGMSLSDAIVLSNLEVLIQGEKWYEMLPLLSLSAAGQHFILLKHPEDTTFPILVASMLIQDWSINHQWLSYATPFSHQQWQYCLPDHAYQELTRLQIFSPLSLPKCYSLPHFDQQFQSLLSDQHAVCEVLRLTVSGNTQQKLYFLYLAQKELMNLLHQMGYKIGLTIIEQPFMLNFYQTIDPKAYFHVGHCDLNDNGKQTYRGLWNFAMMAKVFSQIDFGQYKRAVREHKKHSSLAKG
ncbi:MAG: acyl-homoserine-lactone synthase [Shewanella sp.]